MYAPSSIALYDMYMTIATAANHIDFILDAHLWVQSNIQSPMIK